MSRTRQRRTRRKFYVFLSGLTSIFFTMAKGNLFLGQGRGSVGDVVFYRANGQQLSRSRNRSPRNPKTDAQLIQRAISASVVQAYKMGSIIFDHAFEGREIPGGNQRRFLSVNMRRLRDQVLSEINADSEATSARLVSPGATTPSPWSFRISEGRLTQSLFNFEIEEATQELVAIMVEPQQGESVAQYATRLGLSPGEIYTFVAFSVFNEHSEADLISNQSNFGFARLIVKDDVLTSTTAMSAATYGDIFRLDASSNNFPLIQLVTLGIYVSQVVPSTLQRNVVGSMGVIRSNENSGLRSTSDMVTPFDVDPTKVNDWGVSARNLIEAWSNASGDLQSPLILEGGGF